MIGHMRERRGRPHESGLVVLGAQGNASLLRAPNSPLIERIDDPDLSWVNRAPPNEYGAVELRPHKHEIRVRIAIFSDEAQFGLHVAMRRCVSIGVVIAALAMPAGDVTSVAAPDPRSQLAGKDNRSSVDVELVIAVDVFLFDGLGRARRSTRGLCPGHYLKRISSGDEVRTEQQGGRDVF